MLASPEPCTGTLYHLCLGGGLTYCGMQIAPEAVAELYARWLMPLNKEVQIAYLLRRLDPSS